MPESLAYRTYQVIWHLLDWVYPPECAGCGRPGKSWCSVCHEKVAIIKAPLCPVCGIPQPKMQLCSNCQKSMPYYKTLRSWAVYKDGLRRAIHQLKYHRNISLGLALADPIINQLDGLNWPIDFVLPVPLGLARNAERGYNQASLLAKPIALHLKLPYQVNAMKRIRETRSQVGLSFESRKENVMGAFLAERSMVKGKRILIIDDVTTSGSTMNACAMALCEADAEEVYCFSLARAGLNDLIEQRNVSDEYQ